MSHSVEYVVVLAEDVRKRHRHETDRGKVTHFTVQLEMLVGDHWLPVLRYDCAHGFSHRDAYNRQGQQTKTALDLGFAHALTFADWDINENWETYCDKFMKGLTP